MDETKCGTCGADLARATGGDGGTTDPVVRQLAQHIADVNDPHQTLGKVPRTYVGSRPPSTTDGYKSGDWYADIASLSLYLMMTEVVGGAVIGSWRCITPPPGVSKSVLDEAVRGLVSQSALATALLPYAKSADLAAYVTKDSLDGSGFVTSTYVTEAISSAVSEQSLRSMGVAMSADIEGYATKEYVRSRGYVDAAGVTSAISAALTKDTVAALGFVRLSDLSEAVVQAMTGYVTSEGLSAAIADMTTRTYADTRYATKDDLRGLVGAGSLDELLKGKGIVTRAPTSPGTFPSLDLDIVLAAYATKSDLSGYVTKTDAREFLTSDSIAGLASKADVERAVAGTVTEEELNTALSSYVTTSVLNSRLADRVTMSALYEHLAELRALVETYVKSSLSPYLTSAAASSTFITELWLKEHGYKPVSEITFPTVDTSRFVYRNGTSTKNIDSILERYVLQSLFNSTVSDLNAKIGAISVTKGVACERNLAQPVPTGAGGWAFDLKDHATNLISLAEILQTSASLVGDTLTVIAPAFSSDNVARDFLVTVDLASYSETPVGSATPVKRLRPLVSNGGDPVYVFSDTSDIFDMTDVRYGDVVTFAFTENVDRNAYTVTRRTSRRIIV